MHPRNFGKLLDGAFSFSWYILKVLVYFVFSYSTLLTFSALLLRASHSKDPEPLPVTWLSCLEELLKEI